MHKPWTFYEDESWMTLHLHAATRTTRFGEIWAGVGEHASAPSIEQRWIPAVSSMTNLWGFHLSYLHFTHTLAGVWGCSWTSSSICMLAIYQTLRVNKWEKGPALWTRVASESCSEMVLAHNGAIEEPVCCPEWNANLFDKQFRRCQLIVLKVSQWCENQQICIDLWCNICLDIPSDNKIDWSPFIGKGVQNKIQWKTVCKI